MRVTIEQGAPLRRRAVVAAAVIGVLAAPALPAQHGGDGFLFGRPGASATFRGGFSQASARGDLYDQLVRDLTIERRDFGGATYGGEFGVTVASPLEITLDAMSMATSTPSSYRDYVDNEDREIEQTTVLRRVPLTANAKLYLSPRGRAIGRLAWIPSRFAPWVSAGGGVMWYRFRQQGSFVDFETNGVYDDRFESGGNTPVVQGRLGADVTVGTRLAITGEGRYLWAKRARLGYDFIGYEPLDLSGAVVSLGLTVRL